MTRLLPLSLICAAACAGQVRESRERPDLLEPDSPRGLRVVQITTDAARSSWNVYTEAPVFTPDSGRFLFVREGTYWLCDIRQGFSLRPLIEEKGATAPAVTPDGKWVYYLVSSPRGSVPALRLKRISLKDYKTEAVLTVEENVPGTAYRPTRIYSLSSISADGRKLCTSSFLGDGQTPNAPWGLLVFDLRKPSVSVIVLGHDFNNAHPQYTRSKDPAYVRDIMVQHNHGSVVDPSGRTLTLVSGAGADLHVVRDDGSNWRDIPIGRDGTERVQGHEQWRARMHSVLSAMSMPGRNRILEGYPIPTDKTTSHRGAAIPGARFVDITRGLERADFVHFSADDSGMHLVSDSRTVDPATKARTAALFVGTLSPGSNPELSVVRLLDTRSSFGSAQPTHPHPFFSPDGRMAFFNSDESGRPQVYMVTGYEFPRAR